MEDRPETFVARDRARRLGYRLEKVLQERRLAWRGEAIGMATLKDEADQDLLAIARDARASAVEVLEGRLRDRERGWMEVPFAVVATTVAGLLERAAGLEAERRAGRGDAADAEKAILELLGRAAARLEAFQEAYDAKRVLGEPGPVDVARLLQGLAPPGAAAYDRPPPVLGSDRHGLGDLLLAVAEAAGGTTDPWTVEVAPGGRGVRLLRGEASGEVDASLVPPEVARAAEVLAWLHPVTVLAHARSRALGGRELAGLEVGLEDPAGRSLELSVEALAGGRAPLAPGEEKAVRLLLSAPPLEADRPPPPERLVALLGLLRAFDAALHEVLLPRLGTGAVREAAAALPREATRKAPLRPTFVRALEEAFPEVPFQRAGDLARDLARGQRPKRLAPGEAAALLALLGRRGLHAGVRLEAALPRGGLDDADVERLVEDLGALARIRPPLEAGGAVDAAQLTRLEAATLGALGRLRRM